jgi:hypothetical protein
MPDRTALSLPVTEPRPARDDDQYYPLLKKIPEERLWYTSDIVKIVQSAEFRDASHRCDIKAIMKALGVPYK